MTSSSATTPSRYPSSLSQVTSSGPGPSRPARGYPTPSIDSSIGSPPSSISSSLASEPLNEYSSLADLLQKAGYKETRVFTPEAEKIKSSLRSKSKSNLRGNGNKIKKTFDEVQEDEINSLYGTYGFKRQPNNDEIGSGMGMGLGLGMERSLSEEERMIKHQHITEFEPGLPMKSSSSILRSLAIQDKVSSSSSSSSPSASNSLSKHDETPENSWWNGWGVVGSSNGKNKDTSKDGGQATSDTSTKVGLGLAKNGQGVRKVKSAWEVDQRNKERPRRAGTDSPPQEERPPPRQRVISTPTDLNNSNTPSATGYTYASSSSASRTHQHHYNDRINDGQADVFTSFSSPPPPQLINDDEYGYSPLPEDYEEQCTEDEALYGTMGVNDFNSIYSLGSNSSNPTSASNSFRDTASILSSHNNNNGYDDFANEGNDTLSTITDTQTEREGSEDRAVREINEFQRYQYRSNPIHQQYQYGLDQYDNNQAGRRILNSAVNVDQLDFDSPESQNADLPDEDPEERYFEERKIGMDNGVPNIPLPFVPQSSSMTEHEESIQKGEIKEVVGQKKQLKYGDRATKLRIAHSTPALRQAAISSNNSQPLPDGWLGSIRSALLGKASETPIPPTGPLNVVSQPRGPIKISQAKPALPTLITTSPVICDSISTEAVDLPPVPSNTRSRPHLHQTTSISNLALRFRPSLARLRSAVLGESIPSNVGADDKENDLVLSPRLNWDEQGEQFAGWSPYKSRINTQREDVGIDGLFGPQPDSFNVATIGTEIDYSKSFFYKPVTPPSSKNPKVKTTITPSTPPSSTTFQSSSKNSTTQGGDNSLNKKRSIKSLKAALLLPVAPTPVEIPAIPKIPDHLSHLATPRKMKNPAGTPILAIQSPGAWVPRELVLEGEEWDARDGATTHLSDWGRGRGKGRSGGGGKVRRRRSKKVVRD